MDNTLFPKNFPDIGGLTFGQVATDPKYAVFREFVVERMENCTGLFLVFQQYLLKRMNNSLTQS